ncbi:50S ribosomal protein L3 [Patescibacteria group bacterium]|nr:50S ribosomal protein L3 [Patescibacteria group bacterium]
MIQAILGIKKDQSQTFTPDGKRIPVTRVSTASCRVVNVKTEDKDGYNAIQLGIGSKRAVTLTKPELGNLKKAGLDKNPPRFLREVSIENKEDFTDEKLKPGSEIKTSDVFKEGDVIQVTGVTKGKGFQGAVKRHHFKGGPRTHGQSDRERAPGSIGQTTTPGRVYRGKRMAGHMGSDTVTVKNLKVVKIDDEKNILTVLGVVPGGRNSLLVIKKLTN